MLYDIFFTDYISNKLVIFAKEIVFLLLNLKIFAMSKSIAEDPVAQFGAGMTGAGTVGHLAGASAIAHGSAFANIAGGLAGTKAGAAVGGLLFNPATAPLVIGGGVLIIAAAGLNRIFKWW